MSGDYTEFQHYQRKLDRPPQIAYIRDPGKKVQLKTLFQHVIDRDLANINKFRHQGFPGIFQAHESKTGNTVLHVAAYKNDLELVTFFLKEDTDVDARNRGGVTPLMVAAHHGFLDLVKLLIANDADLELEDRFGQNALWYCFGGTERHAQIAAVCMEAENSQARPGSNVTGKPILVKACEKGNKTLEIVQLLLRHGSDANEAAIRTGRTPLMESARRGSTAVMKFLLDEGANPDAVDYKQVHAAHEAAYHGHVPALQLLASAGAHLDTPSYNGNTPLHLAVSSQQLTAVRYLAHRGGNCNAKNKLGLTPKTTSKKYGLNAAGKEMKKGERQFAGLKDKKFCVALYDWIQNNVEKLKTAIESHTSVGDTIQKDDLPVILQSAGAPVAEEEMGQLADILDSKKTGSISVLELLKWDRLVPKVFKTAAYPLDAVKGKKGKKGKKRKKKQPKLKLPKGFTIPICAADEDQTPMKFTDSPFVVKHVFPGEKDVVGRAKSEKSTPFSNDSIWTLSNVPVDSIHINTLCQLGDWGSVIRACQKGFNINQCDKQFKTPLMYASAAGRWDMVQMLLAYGADINAVDNFGWTALHHACRKGQVVVVDELIQSGAKVNEHTMAGGTPLMKAIESNNLDCVLCCVVSGANLKSKTVCGLSIKDYAKTFGKFRIYRALSRYLSAYKGGRNLQKSLAAVDPNTKFALGSRDLNYEYGKDIRGVFRRQRFLERKTLVCDLLHADLPVRAVKAKANPNANQIGYGGNVVSETNPSSPTDPARPPARIPVSITGKPLNIPNKTKTNNGLERASLPDSDPKILKPLHAASVEQAPSNDSFRSASLKDNGSPSTGHVQANPAAQDKRQKIRNYFAEANKKFEALTTTSQYEFSKPDVADPFVHYTTEYGRSQQAKVIEGRTELERTAWMMKNHMDVMRNADPTFYAPAPDDWYPPSNEDIMRYQIKPGLFDYTVKPRTDEDPLEKYIHKVEKQMEEDIHSKQQFEQKRPEDSVAEKNMSKRFSIAEELKKMHKLRPMEGHFMNNDEVVPSTSLIDNFLSEIKKENATDADDLAFSSTRKEVAAVSSKIAK